MDTATIGKSFNQLLNEKIGDNNKEINILASKIEKRIRYREFIEQKIKKLTIEMPSIKKALLSIDLNAYEFSPYIHFNENWDYLELPYQIPIDIKCNMVGRRKPVQNLKFLSDRVERILRSKISKHEEKVKELGYRIKINPYSLDNEFGVKVILNF